jgi:hypothetical protein
VRNHVWSDPYRLTGCGCGCRVASAGRPENDHPLTPRRASRLRLTGKALKVTIVFDAAALAGVTVPDGTAHQEFAIDVGDRKVVGCFNAKSLRRAIRTINENGPDKMAVMVQARFAAGDVSQDAELSAIEGVEAGSVMALSLSRLVARLAEADLFPATRAG